MEQISKKLMNWASILEDNTREQAVAASTMPFIYPHLALMPDAHLGKGATVGSVIPTLGAIMPAAVGVDIGCGMIAVRTQHTEESLRALLPDGLGRLRESIEARIPTSAGKYNSLSTMASQDRIDELSTMATAADMNMSDYGVPSTWRLQLGTLGSGNHFIEISVDEQSRVWLFLHSGSRGIGNKIAQHHIAVAQDLCRRWHISLPNPDLAYLVEGTPEFDKYIRELRWAQRFALLNREEMMDRLVDQLELVTGVTVERERTINCHHNYTMQERHFGQDVWLSRKGAIDASEGVWGLVPGSMGTRSYVVEGKGNRLALNSSPHGAGREYSRTAARKTFTREQLDEAMTGIEWRHTDAFLDEIPQAYKDIDVVMEDAADLVTIRHTLRQILNVKGD
jgi:tRNA-splicing ligase RtcB